MQEEIKKILERHQHWLNKDCDGWREMRANLYGVNLRGINLSGVNLRGACLSESDLSESNIRKTDLRGACLWGTYLWKSDLSESDLSESDLRKADLGEADLWKVNIRKADLRGADLSGAKNIPFIPFSCPDTGAFIGWKKASDKIVCLEIPSDAKRLSATGRKCRCDKAKVLSITELNGEPYDLDTVKSNYDSAFMYKVGEIVSVENFDENRWNECSTGIHFFINRQEAVEY